MNKVEYLFQLLMEEACEVGQAASKCTRFTPHHKYYDKSNIERLQIEITDILTIISLIEQEIGYKFELEIDERKVHRVKEYMRISSEMGTLRDDADDLR